MNNYPTSPLSDAYGNLRPEDILPQGLDECRHAFSSLMKMSYQNIAITVNESIALYSLLTTLLHTECKVDNPLILYPPQHHQLKSRIQLAGFQTAVYEPSNIHKSLEQGSSVIAILVDFNSVTQSSIDETLVLACKYNIFIIALSSLYLQLEESAIDNIYREYIEKSCLFFIGQISFEQEVLGYILAKNEFINRFSVIHRSFAIGASISLQKKVSLALCEKALPQTDAIYAPTQPLTNLPNDLEEHLYGLASTRSAIAEFTGVAFPNIAITTGGCMAINCVLKTLYLLELKKLQKLGDEPRLVCLCPLPHFPGYDGAVRLNGFQPIYFDIRDLNEHDILIQRLQEMIGELSPSIVLLNFPHNPTGNLITDQALTELLYLAQNNDFSLVFDEAFDGLEFNRLPSRSQQVLNHSSLIRCGSLNKRFPKLADERIGYVVADTEFLKYATEVHSLIIGNVSIRSQEKVHELLTQESPWIQITKLCQELVVNRDLALSILAKSPYLIPMNVPDGGFFLCLVLPYNADCRLFSYKLRERTGIWCANAVSFGCSSENWIRFRFAAPRDEVVQNAERLVQFAHSFFA